MIMQHYEMLPPLSYDSNKSFSNIYATAADKQT